MPTLEATADQISSSGSVLPVPSDSAAGETEARAEFYQTHLDRVSRSFAFCIARLEAPLREYVGLSYLLCRLVDTVEDADWNHFSSQAAAFAEFDGFLKDAPMPSQIAAWRAQFPAGLPDGEVRLLQDAEVLLGDFHRLPNEVGEILGRLILSMSSGMRHFMERKSREADLRLRDLSDVNRYCFFVAGVVGEMLNHLLALTSSTAVTTPLVDSFRFGLFLQKVNLLKDQAGDEQLGRFLVPSRSKVFRSALGDAEIAFAYLKSLPRAEAGFRLFCAWSLFLGLASLPWIERAARDQRRLKIPRDEAMVLIFTIESQLDDDLEMNKLFDSLKSAAQAAAPVDETQKPAMSALAEHEERALLALYRGEAPASAVLEIFRG